MYIFKYFRDNSSLAAEIKTQTFEIGYCRINYFKDFCYNLSTYLLNSVYEYNYLDEFNLYKFINYNDEENISIDKLDIRLSQIFKFISLPNDWTLLGHIDDLDTSIYC